MGHRLTWVSQRGKKKVALAPRTLGSREPSKDSRPSPPSHPQGLEVSFALGRIPSDSKFPPRRRT